MDNERALEIALTKLHEWAIYLCDASGGTLEEADDFFNEIKSNVDLLQEFAYYYDKREFLCRLSVDGYTLADIMIWQIDHFRSHMDRLNLSGSANRDKLIYSTFNVMIDMTKNPDKIKERFTAETGIDLSSGWDIH